MVSVDRDGSTQPLIEGLDFVRDPRFSPDGRRLAFTAGGLSSQVWIRDLDRGTMNPLTFAWDNQLPVWPHDAGGAGDRHA